MRKYLPYLSILLTTSCTSLPPPIQRNLDNLSSQLESIASQNKTLTDKTQMEDSGEQFLQGLIEATSLNKEQNGKTRIENDANNFLDKVISFLFY